LHQIIATGAEAPVDFSFDSKSAVCVEHTASCVFDKQKRFGLTR